jgi:hypothetical protein
MITFLIFSLVLVGSPIVGVIIMAIGLVLSPGRFVDTEGPSPIYIAVPVGMFMLLTFFLFLIGLWVVTPVFTVGIGMFLALPLCWHYAEYLDDLKAFLWTPQQAGKRKEATPCYPKAEPIPVEQEELMAMVYYSRD